MQNLGHKLRAAIAHLSQHGCDLTDPFINERIRADDAQFHLGYLEEICGCRLRVEDVLRVAHRMARETRRDRPAPPAWVHPAARVGLN